jgi:hypothetical protein
MLGRSDPHQFIAAIRSHRILITANHRDFVDLHDRIVASGGRHAGLLTVRYDNDPTKDMKAKNIVTAIGKLERAAVAIANDYIVLNAWR